MIIHIVYHYELSELRAKSYTGKVKGFSSFVWRKNVEDRLQVKDMVCAGSDGKDSYDSPCFSVLIGCMWKVNIPRPVIGLFESLDLSLVC